MQFFRYFPTVPYTFTLPDGTQSVLELTNSTSHVKIMERLRQNITIFYDYIIQDGERPDSVAYHIYGSVNYTWIILLLNGIFTLFDWPLSQYEFNNFLVEKYGSIAAAQAVPIYRTSTGVVVDAITYGLLPVAHRGSAFTAYDDELMKNEAKRRIKIVPVDFVGALVTDLKQVLA